MASLTMSLNWTAFAIRFPSGEYFTMRCPSRVEVEEGAVIEDDRAVNLNGSEKSMAEE